MDKPRKPTIQDVARQAGVSVGTVSNVLNHNEHVAADIRTRVVDVAKQLGYSRNNLARGLRRKQTMSLGLLLPTMLNPFYPALVRGVEDEAHSNGYSVFVCSTDRKEAKERLLIASLLERRVDGLIAVSPSRPLDELLEAAEEVAFVVVEGGRMGHASRDSVSLDAAQAIAAGAAHLHSLGHKRLGFVKGPVNVPRAEERWVLWQQAALSCGMEWIPGAVYTGDFSFESGVEAGRHILGLDEIPTAIIAANDLMALGALKTVMEAGYQVPRDVSIIGFDDIAPATYVTPALTTIAVPTYEQGRATVSILKGRMSEPDRPRQNICLEAVFVQRGSTAEAPLRS